MAGQEQHYIMPRAVFDKPVKLAIVISPYYKDIADDLVAGADERILLDQDTATSHHGHRDSGQDIGRVRAAHTEAGVAARIDAGRASTRVREVKIINAFADADDFAILEPRGP